MILTDEMIEKAARAIRDRPPATISGDYMMGRCRLAARAALEAVLPEILEEAAKVEAEICRLLLDAQDIYNDLPDDSDVALANGMILEATKLAAAIRNLKPKEEGVIPPEHERVLYEKRFELLADDGTKEEGQ